MSKRCFIHLTLLQAGEMDQVNTFVKINYRNAIRKVLLLFHGNLNVLLYVLHKIINKIHGKTEIAQNDTDLSCKKCDITFQNVLQKYSIAQFAK